MAKTMKYSKVRGGAVVFDAFGTLFDFDEANRGEGSRLVMKERLGLTDEESRIARLYQLTHPVRNASHVIKQFWPERAVTRQDIAAINDAVLDEITSIKFINPDTAEILAQLKASGYRLGLISNIVGWTADAISPVLRGKYSSMAHLLRPLPGFDCIVFSCDVGFVKPDPRIYQYFIDRLGESPDKMIMIGDQKAKDCDAPMTAGMEGLHFVPKGKTNIGKRRIADIRDLLTILP